MKKNEKTTMLVHDVLKYGIRRAYFGKITGKELNDAYSKFVNKESKSKPVTKTQVDVGYIDGRMICRVLWNEMSYNPVRFGDVLPLFEQADEYSLFRFCDDKNFLNYVSQVKDKTTYEVLFHVQEKLKDFQKFNNPGGVTWNDIINPGGGKLVVKYIDGHSDDIYKKLSALRGAVRVIISQNLQDLRRKDFRTAMTEVVKKRHPNGKRGKDNISDVKRNLANNILAHESASLGEELYELYNREEMLTITLETSEYLSQEQCEKAKEELENVRFQITEILNKNKQK